MIYSHHIQFILPIVLFIISNHLTPFNFFSLIASSDAIVKFITEDFLPPALPKSNSIVTIIESVLVTIALPISSTHLVAVLSFVVAPFGAEKFSPSPEFTKYIHYFATFLRNIQH